MKLRGIRRRIVATCLVAASLTALSVHPGPASAGARGTPVPKEVSLEDPAGDANYLNTQRLVVRAGDLATPVDASAAADIKALWFTHTDDEVTAHIQTEAPIAETESAYIFRVHINPGSDTNCVWFEAVTPGPNNPDGPYAVFADNCSIGSTWTVTKGMRAIFSELPDGTGLVRIQTPRRMHPLLNAGGELGSPYVTVRNYHFGEVTAPVIDETREGEPYRLTGRT